MALLKSNQKLQKEDTAPPFTLKNIDGGQVSLEDFSGKCVAIIFMCNHCPFVIPKMDEIAALQKEYGEQVPIICINSNDPTEYPEDNFENMQKIAEEKGYTFYLFDETQDVAKAYGAVCTPDPFLFDKEHKLAYHGRINDAMTPNAEPTKHELKEAITKVTSGEEITEWFIPSQGCSIKWKK